jgi:hypothetical protein
LRIAVLGALLIAGTGAAALLGDDNRLMNAAVAAAIIGGASFLAYTRNQINKTLWLIAGGAGLAGALVALIVHGDRESACTAINASGERIVIGTEFTDEGKSYKLKHPAEDNNAILEALGGYGPELVWTPESIRRCRIALALSGSLWIPLFGVAAVAAISLSGIGGADRAAKPVRLKPWTFISYNHEDATAAMRLKQLLEQNDIEVILDSGSMSAGQGIPDFTRKSILDCDVTVCVISSRSLRSAWVASEIIGTINRNKWGQPIRLIGCYLDEQWFQLDFQRQCTHQIDERLRRIEEEISAQAAEKVNSPHLNEERIRLYELRNNLGTILEAFKGSLCLDIREEHFKDSGRQLVAAIRSSWSEAASVP